MSKAKDLGDGNLLSCLPARLADRVLKLIFEALGIHRDTINRPAALQSPSLGKKAGIHCIEAELVIEHCDDCLVGGIVAGQRKASTLR